MANNNLILIVAVVLGVFLLSGGLTGNIISMPTIKPITQTSMMAPAIQTKPVFNPNVVTSDLNALKTNTWNQYVSLVAKDAELDYKINRLNEAGGALAAVLPGCTCICGVKGDYAHGVACLEGCSISGGSGGGPGGTAALCAASCTTYCGNDPVIKSYCENIC